MGLKNDIGLPRDPPGGGFAMEEHGDLGIRRRRLRGRDVAERMPMSRGKSKEPKGRRMPSDPHARQRVHRRNEKMLPRCVRQAAQALRGGNSRKQRNEYGEQFAHKVLLA
jgi:hypothetical protein